MYIGFVKDYEVVVLYYLINKLNHKLFVNCFPFKGKVNYIRWVKAFNTPYIYVKIAT